MKKSEVKNLKDWIKENLPTRQEVRHIVEEIVEEKIDELAQATNAGFQSMQEKMATKDDLKAWAKETDARLDQKLNRETNRVFDKIDVAVEIRKTDLLGVAEDEIRDNIRKTGDHEERLTTLERRAGVAV